MRPVHLCLFAFIGSDNVGDEAIFQTIYRDLQSLRPEAISILSMNPARTRAIAKSANVQVVPARLGRESLTALYGCDVFVCGGGGIFQDQTSVYNPSRYLSRIQIALTLRKRVFVYGVGVGPLKHPLNRRLMGEVLKRAECLTVRDEGSRQALIELGVPASRVHTTGDPVINFSDLAHPPVATQPGKNILVCLRHWFDTIDWLPVSVVNALHVRSRENVFQYDNFVSNMADILDHVARDPDVILTFVPFWGVRDTRVHRAVIAKMQRSAQCKVVEDSPSPERAAELIRSADLLIGMRLHSLILAVASARPFFAIDYSKKVGDFLEEVLPGRVGLVSCSPKDLVAAEVIAKLNALERVSPFDSAYVRRIGELKLKKH